MSTCRRIKIDPYLSTCTKLKFSWIKNFNINLTTLNLIEEKVRSSIQCIGRGDNFLNIISVAQKLRATINKWDLLKVRSFYEAKDIVNKTKDSLLIGKRSLPIPHQKED